MLLNHDEVTMMAFRDQPLGELALSIPRASALFRKYDMDYCCGGKQTLARAASRKELNLDLIEAELAKLAEQPLEKDWRNVALAEIINHIIVRYHDRHREQLPELILQATKVERVHAEKASVPRGLAKSLTMLHEELSSHMMKEEQILFPMIKQGMGSQAMGPISVMESEHDDAGELVEVIKHITHNGTPPADACTTWRAMYNGINEMIDDLMEHISLENNVLFPRALAGE
jgi:regulator of cell morphogenesis and NO signaling